MDEINGIQQGYLHFVSQNLNQLVFVSIHNGKLSCYPDDPSKSPGSRIAPLASFDLTVAKVVDGGPNVKRPKSFAFSASSLDSTIIAEFSCPTNSLKCQWIKSILDFSKAPVANTTITTGKSLILAPQPSSGNVTTQYRMGNNAEHHILPLSTQALSFHNANLGSQVSQHAIQQIGSQFPQQKQPTSLLISSQRGGITPDGQLKITRKAIGPSLGSGTAPKGGATTTPKAMPGWVPNTFGNNKISSRLVSPQRVSEKNKSLRTEDLKGSGQRHSGRAFSPVVVDNHQLHRQNHHENNGMQHMYDDAYRPNEQQSHSSSSRIDNLTVSELREALQAIPSHIRSSLLSQPADSNRPDYDERRHDGSGRTTENSQSYRSKSAGHGHRHQSSRDEQNNHRYSSPHSSIDRLSANRKDERRSRSVQPQYLRETEQNQRLASKQRRETDYIQQSDDNQSQQSNENSDDTYAQEAVHHHDRRNTDRDKPRISIDVEYRESDFEPEYDDQAEQQEVGEDDNTSYMSDQGFFQSPSPPQRRSSRNQELNNRGIVRKGEQNSRKEHAPRQHSQHAKNHNAIDNQVRNTRSQSVSSLRQQRNGDKSESSKIVNNSRSTSAHHIRDSHQSGHNERNDRDRLSSSVDRKSAVEWSRRNAVQKKNRTDFPASPLHQRPVVNTNSIVLSSSAGLGARPTTPLKFKYQSFGNSLEKEDNNVLKQPRPRTVSNEDKKHYSQDKANKPHYSQGLNRTTHSSEVHGDGGGKNMKLVGGGFHEFLNSRKQKVGEMIVTSTKRPQPSVAVDPALARYRAKHNLEAEPFVPLPVSAHKSQSKPLHRNEEVQRKQPKFINMEPLTKQRAAAPSFDELSSIDQEMSRIRSESNASEYRQLHHDQDNLTDLAEWRRLTDWLKRNSFDKYIRLFRDNDVTKLSIVELLTRADMQDLGIESGDIDLLTKKVNEFTRRTRTFSEQVLLSDNSNNHRNNKNAVVSDKQTENVESNLRPVVAFPARHSVSVKPAGQPKSFTHDNKLTTFDAPLVVPKTYQSKSAMYGDLVASFDSGNSDLFFQTWRTACLVHFPEDYSQLNPTRSALFSTRQVMEFHLYLYFSVYPIMNNLSKEEIKHGKEQLKAYLESIIISSDYEHLNDTQSHTPHSANNVHLSPQAEGVGGDISTTFALSLTSPTLRAVTPSTFMRSREFAIYAGMVMVPEPQSNEAFAQLFRRDWLVAMRVRLLQFLDIVGLNASSTIEVSESNVVDREVLHSMNGNREAVLSTPLVTPRDVQKALFLPTKTSPSLQVPSCLQAAVDLSTKSNGKPVSPPQKSNTLLEQHVPVENIEDVSHTQVQLTHTSPVVIRKTHSKTIDECHLFPPPPPPLVVPDSNLLSPISPPDAPSGDANTNSLKQSTQKSERHYDRHAIHTGEQLTSPMSTTSAISELTDDDNNYVTHQHSKTGRIPLNIGGANSTPRKPLITPALTSPVTGTLTNSGGRVVKTNAAPLTKSAMQNQVNEYNKLLKQSGGLGSKAVPPSIVSADLPEVVVDKERTSDDGGTGNVPSPRGTSSLVLGSNIRPRQLTNPINTSKILGPSTVPKSDNIQAQVSLYNSLLEKKLTPKNDSVATEAAVEPDNDVHATSNDSVEVIDTNISKLNIVSPDAHSEIEHKLSPAKEVAVAIESEDVSDKVEDDVKVDFGFASPDPSKDVVVAPPSSDTSELLSEQHVELIDVALPETEEPTHIPSIVLTSRDQITTQSVALASAALNAATTESADTQKAEQPILVDIETINMDTEIATVENDVSEKVSDEVIKNGTTSNTKSGGKSKKQKNKGKG